MSQTKTQSLIETAVSQVVAFILATVLWALIIPLLFDGVVRPVSLVSVNILFAVVFAAKSYFIRRAFARYWKS